LLIHIPHPDSVAVAEETAAVMEHVSQADQLLRLIAFFAPLFNHRATHLRSLEVRAIFLSFCTDTEDEFGYPQPQPEFDCTTTAVADGLQAVLYRPHPLSGVCVSDFIDVPPFTLRLRRQERLLFH